MTGRWLIRPAISWGGGSIGGGVRPFQFPWCHHDVCWKYKLIPPWKLRGNPEIMVYLKPYTTELGWWPSPTIRTTYKGKDLLVSAKAHPWTPKPWKMKLFKLSILKIWGYYHLKMKEPWVPQRLDYFRRPTTEGHLLRPSANRKLLPARPRGRMPQEMIKRSKSKSRFCASSCTTVR